MSIKTILSQQFEDCINSNRLETFSKVKTTAREETGPGEMSLLKTHKSSASPLVLTISSWFTEFTGYSDSDI